MGFLDDRHKKKSFTITVVIYAILILLLFVVGLKYMDPPEERGVAINFGTTDIGSGAVQPVEEIQSSPAQSTPQEEMQPVSQVKEEVVTQEVVDAPVIQKEKKPEVVKTTPKEQPKEQPKKEPTPDKSTSDALSSILNAPKRDGTAQSGEGNDQQAGDKGSPDGDRNAPDPYGAAVGLDGDGNYRLGNRKADIKPKPRRWKCNEEGKVVVQIEVDRNGEVIKATPGVKGTNAVDCLLEYAKEAALKTKFNSDPRAPAKQVGEIIYHFSISE